jgi:hypothetical protein
MEVLGYWDAIISTKKIISMKKKQEKEKKSLHTNSHINTTGVFFTIC